MMEGDEEFSITPEKARLITRNEEETLHPQDEIGFPSCRLVLTVMSFLGFINVYSLRVNLSVALVEMVNSSYTPQKGNLSAECPLENSTFPDDNISHGEFPWDANIQGLVLGSFFYGYMVTQIPGGWLAEKFGGKWLFGGGVLCTSLLTLLTPIAARTHVYLLIAVRVLEGIGEGVTFPAMHALLSNWAAPLQRSKLGTIIYSGAHMGVVIAMPVSGLLCKYGFAGGWPSVFYVFGLLGCLWFVLWAMLCYDSPAKHPRISRAERNFIEKALGHHSKQKMRTPWKAIFTSMPVFATMIGHVTHNWGYYTLLICIPQYFREVLAVDISQNGFISGLPYLITWVVEIMSGQAADSLREKKLMSTTNVRKLFNTTGLMIPAVFLVATGYVGCDRTLAIAMLTASVGMSGLSTAGYQVNHLDLAPPFAGTLMGLTNTMANIPGFLAPQVVAVLTRYDSSRGQWQIVFYIAAAIYTFGSLVYLVFGSGEEQTWAKSSQYRDFISISTEYSSSDEDEEKEQSNSRT